MTWYCYNDKLSFKQMKRASYRAGIAMNDEPECFDPYMIKNQISTLFLADLFDVDLEKIGKDVVRYRQYNITKKGDNNDRT